MEVLVSISVLAIGLVGLAYVMTNSMSSTVEGKYMSLAATLASEKLEDLNRWPATDPHIAVTSGTTAGSLDADVVQNVTVGANTASVNYFDRVALSAGGGAFSETVTGLDSTGKPIYTTITHSPNGTVISTTSATAPNVAFNFKRRWVIEKDQPTTGVRRVTVRVFNVGPAIPRPVSFQMSMVRP